MSLILSNETTCASRRAVVAIDARFVDARHDVRVRDDEAGLATQPDPSIPMPGVTDHAYDAECCAGDAGGVDDGLIGGSTFAPGRRAW
jgi:hypothetical protein